MKYLLVIFLLLFSSFIFAREIVINQACINDDKLMLEKIVLTEENTTIFFRFKNDDNPRRRIGLYPPDSPNSFYIEDVVREEKYRLADAVGLPKWWPQEIKFLRRFEEVQFQLVFPAIPATFAIHIFEGEGNEDSDAAWNFLNVQVGDIHTLNKRIVEHLQKDRLTTEEQAFIQETSQTYEHVADFVRLFPSKNWTSYEQKWGAVEDAAEMIRFIEADKLIAAEREEYEQVKARNLIREYIVFIEKYCEGDCEDSSSEFVRDAVEKVKAFFNRRQRELVIEGNIESYNTTLELYGDNRYAENIVADYDRLAEAAYRSAVANGTEEQFAGFINSYPYSSFAEQAWEEVKKRYLESSKVEDYQAYLDRYPNSPHYDEMEGLKQEAIKERERQEHVELILDNFKETLNVGENVSYRQIVRATTRDNRETYTFEIQFMGTIVHILTRDVRIRVTGSQIVLLDNLMNDTIRDSYNEMNLITVGGLETVPIPRLDSFPDVSD